MIKLENAIIQADMQDVLNVLKSELLVKGIERFSTFRPNNRNIQTNCPFHKGGQERKPSFGINIDDGRCHCFTCGWSGSISEMISELFGRNDFGKFGESWLEKRFNSVEIETREKMILPSRNRCRTFAIKKYITEEELDKYRYIHPYMYRRGLTDEIIERFDIGFDRDSNCITFPVYNLDGRCVFVARRNVEKKFFQYPQGVEKPVYLANEILKNNYKKVYVCESFLNALTFWKYGRPAVALIGTGTKEQYDILKKLPVREYVLALDPDEAGRKGTEKFRQNVKGKIIKEVIYTTKEDINDLQERCLELKETL